MNATLSQFQDTWPQKGIRQKHERLRSCGIRWHGTDINVGSRCHYTLSEVAQITQEWSPTQAIFFSNYSPVATDGGKMKVRWTSFQLAPLLVRCSALYAAFVLPCLLVAMSPSAFCSFDILTKDTTLTTDFSHLSICQPFPFNHFVLPCLTCSFSDEIHFKTNNIPFPPFCLDSIFF